MPTRMHQRSLAAVVPRVHIRALLQQQRHNVEVALGSGEVERGVEAAEGGVARERRAELEQHARLDGVPEIGRAHV